MQFVALSLLTRSFSFCSGFPLLVQDKVNQNKAESIKQKRPHGEAFFFYGVRINF